MLKSIYEASLFDILPENLLEDKQIQALIKALDIELQSLSKDISQVLLLARLEELPEKVLDLLAWQWHVDFYEPVGLDVETKRNLIRESIAWHRKKGTPAAVEQIVEEVFKEAKVIEWFDYNGQPYRFKVMIDTSDARLAVDRTQLDSLHKVIKAAKNVRSWLDSIILVVNMQDKLELPEESTKLQLRMKYEDIVTYGEMKVYECGKAETDNAYVLAGRDFNLDKLFVNLNVKYEEKYGTIIEAGRVETGKEEVGGIMNLPIDEGMRIELSLNQQDKVTETKDSNGKLTLIHNWKCGADAISGKSCVGTEIMTDELDGNLQLKDVRSGEAICGEAIIADEVMEKWRQMIV